MVPWANIRSRSDLTLCGATRWPIPCPRCERQHPAHADSEIGVVQRWQAPGAKGLLSRPPGVGFQGSGLNCTSGQHLTELALPSTGCGRVRQKAGASSEATGTFAVIWPAPGNLPNARPALATR